LYVGNEEGCEDGRLEGCVDGCDVGYYLYKFKVLDDILKIVRIFTHGNHL
jgi:hypothetical protein